MNQRIFCLMTGGGALTHAASLRLYLIACEMFRKGEKRHQIKTSSREVTVDTKFNYACIGVIAGTEFSATIEENKRTIRTSFLVRETDLENGSIIGIGDITAEELSLTPEVKASMN